MSELPESYDERLKYFATAPRVGAKQISQFIDGGFITSWVGTLRGRMVKTDNGYKFSTREEALNNARNFRSNSLAKALDKGLEIK